jgi:ribonuclease BN (tRNA processing enzyme)
MSGVQVTFLGSGDAFGSGGRFQTCILLRSEAGGVLVDCGASSLIAMRRFGTDPNAIGTILLSHLHGDHYGGVPFFILDAQLISRRTQPLRIAGPPGTRQRLDAAMDALFPGMRGVQQKYAIEIVELTPGDRAAWEGLAVTPQAVRHTPGTEPTALRIECGGRTLCYTGDTEWCESLVPAAQGVDLLIAEAYTHDKRIPMHLDLATLRAHLDELAPRRVILTHMSADMLARVPELDFECAEDGLVVEV